MPRTGLPELFRTAADCDAYISGLRDAGVITDASHVWWDIRPSAFHPTLELRITDVCTRIEDAISIASIYRCLIKHLSESTQVNADLDALDRAFAEENKWRAERFGTRVSFVERGARTAQTPEVVLRRLLIMLRPDAERPGDRARK